MARTWEWLTQPAARLGRFIALLVGETIGLGVIITIIRGMHWYVSLLGSPMLFNRIPVAYATDAAEFGVLWIYVLLVVATVAIFAVKELLRHR
jgi:hypothetical protein